MAAREEAKLPFYSEVKKRWLNTQRQDSERI